MRFYIIFCTNVMSGLTLLLDFLLPPFRFKVQSSAISHPFWTFSCTPPLPRSNPPLFLAPFGLPPASSPLQSPILRSFSLLLDFRVPLLRLKVQSSALSHSFWTSACLPSASRSNPPLFLAPFGLSPASPPLQSPILRSFSLLLDFLVPPLHFKVQSSALSRSFWTSSHLPATSKSNPQLFRSPPRKKGGLQSNPPVAIRQSQSASLNQPFQSFISQFHQVKHLQ